MTQHTNSWVNFIHCIYLLFKALFTTACKSKIIQNFKGEEK
jgi:hypothetical protein